MHLARRSRTQNLPRVPTRGRTLCTSNNDAKKCFDTLYTLVVVVLVEPSVIFRSIEHDRSSKVGPRILTTSCFWNDDI